MRRLLGVLGAVLVALPLSGCGLFEEEVTPRDVAAQFAAAFAGGDSTTASGFTDSPEAAKAFLDQARDKLKPTSLRAGIGAVTDPGETDAAIATYRLTWDLGKGREWAYDSAFDLRRAGDTWKVHWVPSVVHPELSPGQTLAVQSIEPRLAPVLDRDGTPVLSPIEVVSVLFEQAKAPDASATAAALAAALGGIDPAITQQSILDGAAAAKDQPYTVAVLRNTDYQAVRAQIYELPGVRFTQSTRLLPADKDFAPALVPTVRKLVEEQVEGKSGWRVLTVDSTGAEGQELFAQQPESADAVRSVMSVRLQQAAQGALDGIATPAMIVAIQPSTGALLAVGQNPAADKEGAVALTGRYPPGSTFKTVTATAAMNSGLAAADTPLGCPPTTTVDGRVIPNSNRFDKGVVPLHAAFAFSCNTTFADLAVKMQPGTLTDMAERFGLGVDFVIPGVTTITGSVPPAQDLVERAEDGIGQGKVVASPFGMALVAATAVTGRVVPPVLMADTPTQADKTPEPLTPGLLEPLRAMMREVVVSGTATALAPLPEVHGKTGTAQFGDGSRSHGWFVGYQGDLAFAVLVTDAGESGPAVQAASRFLGAVG